MTDDTTTDTNEPTATQAPSAAGDEHDAAPPVIDVIEPAATPAPLTLVPPEAAPRRGLRLQCTAMARPGRRCRRAPIPGGIVCSQHGGRAPQTVAAARRRLLAGSDYAIDYLLNMLEPRAHCEACGRADNDRDPVILKACQLVLDRAGIGPSGSLTVETAAPHHNLSELTTDYLLERVEAIAQKGRALARLEARVEDALRARHHHAAATDIDTDDITDGDDITDADFESEPIEAAMEPLEPDTEGDQQ